MAASVDSAITADRARLTTLEVLTTGVIQIAANATGSAYWIQGLFLLPLD